MQIRPLGNTEMVAPMISRLLTVVVAVQALALVPTCAQDVARSSPIRVLGITLGDSTLHEVLRSLGPPDAIFLESQDAEGEDPVAGEALIVRLRMPFPLANQGYPATVDFILEPGAYKVVGIGVNFVNSETADSNVSLSEIIATYGKGYRLIRQRWEDLPGGLEAVPSGCVDPNGEIESWVYEAQGLQVFLSADEEGEKKAEGLSFSASIRKKDSFPPCDM